jgi:hypothetical protein
MSGGYPHPGCLQKSAEATENTWVGLFLERGKGPKSAQRCEMKELKHRERREGAEFTESLEIANRRSEISEGVHPRAIWKVVKRKGLREKQFVRL